MCTIDGYADTGKADTAVLQNAQKKWCRKEVWRGKQTGDRTVYTREQGGVHVSSLVEKGQMGLLKCEWVGEGRQRTESPAVRRGLVGVYENVSDGGARL